MLLSDVRALISQMCSITDEHFTYRSTNVWHLSFLYTVKLM